MCHDIRPGVDETHSCCSKRDEKKENEYEGEAAKKNRIIDYCENLDTRCP